jgi:hypothetical protein
MSETLRRETKHLKDICPSSTLSTTDPLYAGLARNLDLLGGKRTANNRCSHGMLKTIQFNSFQLTNALA